MKSVYRVFDRIIAIDVNGGTMTYSNGSSAGQRVVMDIEKLSKAPSYEEMKKGAECFYLNRLSLLVNLFNEVKKAGAFDYAFEKKTERSMREAFEKTVKTRLDENEYLKASMSADEIKGLKRFFKA